MASGFNPVSDITFNCPKCGKGLEVDSQAAGLTVNCPACSQPVQIPAKIEAPVRSDAETNASSTSIGTERQAAPPISMSPSKQPATTARANGLFVFVRYFVLGISLCLIAGILIAGIRLFHVSRRDAYRVSYQDVKSSMNRAKSVPTSSSNKSEVDSQLPDNIRKFLTDNNRKQMFLGWIEDLDPVQRKDFISNLSTVIAETDSKSDDEAQVVSEYARIKRHKLSLNLFENYSTQATKYALLTFVVFMMGLLLALFSLNLVLLSIERNTRRL